MARIPLLYSPTSDHDMDLTNRIENRTALDITIQYVEDSTPEFTYFCTTA